MILFNDIPEPCCTSFPQVQFGHAGACANQASETAVSKNQALKEAGAFVPKSFDELGEVIKSVTFIPSIYANENITQGYSIC